MALSISSQRNPHSPPIQPWKCSSEFPRPGKRPGQEFGPRLPKAPSKARGQLSDPNFWETPGIPETHGALSLPQPRSCQRGIFDVPGLWWMLLELLGEGLTAWKAFSGKSVLDLTLDI